MDRATALSPPALLRLDLWAPALAPLFEHSPYLVGSALERTDPRDVDVRQLLPDDDPLLADPDRLRLLNTALSVWAEQVSGLPVDFQFQSETEWRQHDGRPRNPLGSRWRTLHPRTG